MAQWLLAFLLFNEYIFIANSQCSSSTWDGWYTGASLHQISGNWGDSAGGNTITVPGLQQHQVSGGPEINGQMYISGTTAHSFSIGPIIGYNNYTIFHVARLAEPAPYQRIFTSASDHLTNWASGFHGSHFKTAFHGGWVAPRIYPANSIDWIISTDSLNIYRANGQDLTAQKGTASINQITVNKYDNELSNFAIAELIIINGETKSESYMECVETYLSNKYNIPLYTIYPTKSPSISPTDSTNIPTNNPTNSPTKYPTNNPLISPTKYPTSITNNPTLNPSKFPTFNPSKFPSNIPTFNPIKVSSSSPTSAHEYGITDDKDGEVIESTNVLFINKVSEKMGTSASIIAVIVIVPLFICFILICCVVYKIKKDKQNKSQSTFMATDTNVNTNEQRHEQNIVSVEIESMMDGDMIITGYNETNGQQEEMDDFVVETKGNDNDDDIIIVNDVNETHGNIQKDSGIHEKVRSSFVVDDDEIETAKTNDDSVSGSDQLVVNDINEMQTLQ